MGRILISVSALLLWSHGWACAPAVAAADRRTDDAVSFIRGRYAAINRNLPKYRMVKKELSGFSAEGGELAAYFDGAAVMKVAATNYGETGRTLEEFYYWNGELIFVFRRRDEYDAPLSGRVSKTAEDRFYFEGGLLIRWIDERGRAVPPRGREYLEAQARNRDSSKRLLDAARSPHPVVEAPGPEE